MAAPELPRAGSGSPSRGDTWQPRSCPQPGGGSHCLDLKLVRGGTRSSGYRQCQLRTASFWLRCQALSCVLTACLVFMGPDKLSSFCNYLVEPHLPTSCGAFTFGGRMRPRVKRARF
jgi:hypothetical protein